MTVPVGVASCTVDVPRGTPLAGFAARDGLSEGVHDYLTVRAIALDQVTLVSVDVCTIHESTIFMVRERLATSSTVLLATHTHSGPCTAFGRLGGHSQQVHDALVEAIVEVAQRANRCQVPATVDYGEAAGLQVAFNRRAGRWVDPPVQALRCRSVDGRTIAWFVSFPCHPVVLDASNRYVSGDYPAFLRTEIERRYPHSLCLFATGAAGDINTGHRVDASLEAKPSSERTFAQASRIGRRLAEAVSGAIYRPVDVGGIHLRSQDVELRLNVVDEEVVRRDKAEWEAELRAGCAPARKALLESWLRWATNQLDAPSHRRTWSGRVSLIRIGDVHLAAVPGEPFLSMAGCVGSLANGPTILLGYADGGPGYLPPTEEYEDGGYEVVDAHRFYGMPGPFERGSAERMIDALSGLFAGARRS